MARKKVVKEVVLETLDPRVYEVGYLLSPAVRDENLTSALAKIQETITTAGGTIIAEGEPEFIDLAYEMTRVIENKNIRFTQAYFGWIKFTIEPKQIVEINAVLETNIDIIRFLVLKTVVENTIIAKNPLSKILKKRKEEVAVAVEEETADDEDILAGVVTPDSIVAEVAEAQGIEIPDDVSSEQEVAAEQTETGEEKEIA
jgi:ribosomal protein S6